MKPVGYIYAIKSRRFVKVGHTLNLLGRFREIQVSHPETLRLYDAWLVQSAVIELCEARAHKALRPFRVRGEWFHHVVEIDDLITNAIDEHLVPPHRLSRISDEKRLLSHTGVTPLFPMARKIDDNGLRRLALLKIRESAPKAGALPG